MTFHHFSVVFFSMILQYQSHLQFFLNQKPPAKISQIIYCKALLHVFFYSTFDSLQPFICINIIMPLVLKDSNNFLFGVKAKNLTCAALTFYVLIFYLFPLPLLPLPIFFRSSPVSSLFMESDPTSRHFPLLFSLPKTLSPRLRVAS